MRPDDPDYEPCPICNAKPGEPCADDCPGMEIVFPNTVDEDEAYA